jgi:hypothetical protein
MSSELCSRGHEYTEGNKVTVWKGNTRSCEICDRRNKRDVYMMKVIERRNKT